MKVVYAFLTLMTVAFAATLPSTVVPRDSALAARSAARFDVTALLPTGATTGATGDNAVSTVADDDSGAVGAKGDNVALGVSAPGMAAGFGSGLAGLSNFGSIFGSNSDPAATPVANNFFNIFN